MSYIPKMTYGDRAERQRTIAGRMARGERCEDIARDLGVSVSHVRKTAKLYGVARPAHRPSFEYLRELEARARAAGQIV